MVIRNGAYERLSIVRHLGKTWISAVETTEEPTVGATDWDIMVEDAVFSQPTGFKNYIINGNFDVWQYGTSQTTNGYSSDDRWLYRDWETDRKSVV